MKNKFTKVLLIVSMLVLLIFVACACGGEEEPSICLHEQQTVLEAVAPTCTATGLTPGAKCANESCGKVLVEQTVIPALGHTEVVLDAKAATCTEAGLTEGKKCSVCNEVTVAQEAIEALGHTLTDCEAQAATCTEAGWEAYQACSACDYTTKVEIEALGHTEVVLEAVPATCLNDGKTEGKMCSVCEEVLVEQTVVEATGHTEVVVKGTPATCTEDGKTDGKECSACGEVLQVQKPIFSEGHTKKTINGTPATCTEPGKTNGEVCTVCNKTLKEQKEIKPLGHTLQYHDGLPATCTEAGYEAYQTCSKCNYSSKVELGALGHKMKNYPAQEPTCSAVGNNEYDACERCNYSENKQILDKLDHKYTIDHDALAPTCTEVGWDAYKECEVCHAINKVEKPATGHTPEVVDAVAPTCEGTGLTEGSKCSVCDAILVAQEEVEATGHEYVLDEEKLTDGTPTCKTEGNYEYKCTVCGDTEYNVNGEEPEEIRHEGYTKGEYKTAPTCIAAATYECTTCGETFSAYEDDAEAQAHGNHVLDVAGTPVPATCTEAGYTPYGCSVDENCQETENRDEVPALGHTYTREGEAYSIEYVETKAPTCITKGFKTAKCTECDVTDDTYGRDIDPTGNHVFDVNKGTTDPTCTEGGYTTYGCSADEGCQATENRDEVDALGHTYTREGEAYSIEYVETKAPTCITKGFETAKCTECDATDDTYGRYVDATGKHVFNVNKGTTDPTCTEGGYTTYGCSVDEGCQATENRDETELLGHNWVLDESKLDNGVPTCATEGNYEYKCTRCGETKYNHYGETPDEIRHTYNVGEYLTDPTCITAATYECTTCGEVFTAYEDDVDAQAHGNHDYTIPTYTLDPTCTEGGYTTFKCSADAGCNEVENGAFTDALGHTPEVVDAVPPTCEGTGLTEGSKCSVCEAILVEQEVVDPTGHTPEEIAKVDPTCTETGLEVGSKCSVCDKILTEQEVIPALGHTYTRDGEDFSVEYVETKAPTCITKGFETAKCTECDVTDDTYGRDIDPTGAHVYDVDLGTTAPTCLEIGYTTYGCSADENCQEKQDRDEVDALGHTYERDGATFAYEVTTEPTCITPGEKWVVCEECEYCTIDDEVQNAELYRVVIDPTGEHKYNEVIEEVAPSCTEYGYKYSKCTDDVNCTETIVENWADKLDHNFGAIDPETGKITCQDCGVAYINVTGSDDIILEEKCLTDDECDGIDCDHMKVVVAGKKSPDADTALPEGTPVSPDTDKVVSVIALNGAEDTVYTIELLDAEGNAITTFEVTVGEAADLTHTFDVTTTVTGNAYVDISEVASQVATIVITASADASVAFYTAA